MSGSESVSASEQYSSSHYSSSSGCEVDQVDESSILHRHNVRILGSGKELLFLSHGFGTNQQIWEPVLARMDLQHSYRVILWDLMGAFSTNPEDFDFKRYGSFHAHADDLLEVLDEIGVESITFVGHSVSGMVGMLASIEHPQLFKKLIVIGASCRYLNDHESGYVGGFEVEDLDQLFTAMQTNYSMWASGFAPIAVGDNMESDAVREFSRTLFLIRPDIAFATSKVIFQSDFRHVLGQISRPVHLLQTEKDAAVPMEVAKFLYEHIPKSFVEILPVEGHLPHLTHPSIVAAAIQRHIAMP